MRLVFRRDPAPDTVQGDEIEVRQVAAGAKILERLLRQHGAIAGDLGQFLRKGGLGRIEIGAIPACAGRRGMDIDGHALAKAEFACGADLRRLYAPAQQQQLYAQGVQFRVIAVGVCGFGRVAGMPSAHQVSRISSK